MRRKGGGFVRGEEERGKVIMREEWKEEERNGEGRELTRSKRRWKMENDYSQQEEEEEEEEEFNDIEYTKEGYCVTKGQVRCH